MPIISYLNEYYQSVYTSYLSERYVHLWHMYVEGYKMAPVLTKKTVEAFNISPSAEDREFENVSDKLIVLIKELYEAQNVIVENPNP